MAHSNFPSGSVWGVATASYQIEGAVNEDGRGLSIWDTFSHTPGKTENGDTGDVACDHYHRWPEDVKLLQSLGVNAYRLSIAWPRVIPQGTGQVNSKGLDFYDRLVNALLEVNITPYVTLYHWDLPQALQDRGGWANRDTVNAYVEYVQAVVARLGDRVKHWSTHNEPWVASFVGNYLGRHAPGNHHLPTALQVAHHLLLSHGLAVPVIRSASSGAQVGITLNLAPGHAASQSEADATAARYADGYRNRWFLDPLYGKGYPTDMVARFGVAMPQIQPGDLAQIAVQTDFLGVNFYYPVVVRADPSGSDPLGFISLTPEEMRALGCSITEMGWPVTFCAPGRK